MGVDVSNVKIKNINLSNYPDISNNTPAYTDWDIILTQNFVGTQADKTLIYSLRIGKVPINPVSISNFITVQQTPILTTDFFGLNRPLNSTVATWPVTATLSDLDPTWRPVQSQWLMNGNLFYASAAGAASGNSMTGGEYEQPWSNSHPISVSMSETVDLLRSNLQNSSYYYSRNRNFNPQFYITGTYTNNVTLIPTTTTVTPLNISFNSKHLWWDYTYTGTTTTFATYTLHQAASGEYPTNYSTYNQTYSHSSDICDQQLMWCKTGFTSGNYTTVASENPYIDYNGYYGQTQNYSSKNTTGIAKSLTYTIGNDDYYLGGNVTITGTYKWILLSDVRSNASDFGRIVVKDGGGSALTLGTDFLLYIQEIDTFFSPGVSIPLGYISGRSGWKAVQGTWDQGATVQLNNANEAGAYRRYTNGGAVATYFIKFYSPNANKTMFYRIGIKNGSNIKISDVTITYGTT